MENVGGIVPRVEAGIPPADVGKVLAIVVGNGRVKVGNEIAS